MFVTAYMVEWLESLMKSLDLRQMEGRDFEFLWLPTLALYVGVGNFLRKIGVYYWYFPGIVVR